MWVTGQRDVNGTEIESVLLFAKLHALVYTYHRREPLCSLLTPRGLLFICPEEELFWQLSA